MATTRPWASTLTKRRCFRPAVADSAALAAVVAAESRAFLQDAPRAAARTTAIPTSRRDACGLRPQRLPLEQAARLLMPPAAVDAADVADAAGLELPRWLRLAGSPTR